ncbi:hypothetical protein IMG5_017800 [Ichthyophthirius multifiliis]|uniref:Transmembrane protein n=1 Tax=Ichthyophthirius multifiliis TaxID=5932 RepID=G0QKH4_ICHMU|nr:hypothetical protein IMG5_017800 [Ichthyophthirius multifiliis]EGR34284.1 hypothetical protein IMG5_017800 [Ichthyophthirius multifiliis]|eukprot:XP_004039588.1 hypothetical protein IMG5_017800 [Ichthyophthirius multifiliis]
MILIYHLVKKIHQKKLIMEQIQIGNVQVQVQEIIVVIHKIIQLFHQSHKTCKLKYKRISYRIFNNINLNYKEQKMEQPFLIKQQYQWLIMMFPLFILIFLLITLKIEQIQTKKYQLNLIINGLQMLITQQLQELFYIRISKRIQYQQTINNLDFVFGNYFSTFQEKIKINLNQNFQLEKQILQYLHSFLILQTLIYLRKNALLIKLQVLKFKICRINKFFKQTDVLILINLYLILSIFIKIKMIIIKKQKMPNILIGICCLICHQRIISKLSYLMAFLQLWEQYKIQEEEQEIQPNKLQQVNMMFKIVLHIINLQIIGLIKQNKLIQMKIKLLIII